MIRFFACIVLALLTISLTAQDVIRKVKLGSRSISKVQGFVLNDGFFLSYHDDTKRDEYFSLGYKYLLIGKNGSETPLSIPDISGKKLINVMDSEDSLFFYYVEEQKKQAQISAFSLKKTSWRRKDLPQRFLLPEEIIGGAYSKNNFFLASLEKETKSLHVVQIHGVELVSDIAYELPKDFFKEAGSAKVIWDGVDVTPQGAEARVKIYISHSQIIASYDEFTGSRGIVHILRIDRATRNVSSFEIEERATRPFSSFIFQDNIYRISRHNGALVSVFNMNKELISSFRVDKKVPYARETAYFRRGSSLQVLGDRNVWDAISNLGSVFISVHPGEGSFVILKIGTHHIGKKSVPMPLPMFNPVLFIGVPIQLSRSADNNSDYYFYLKGNPNTGFTYSSSSTLIQQKIDNFELFDPKREIEYTHKSYLKGEDSTWYGLYLKKKSNELEIVKFNK